MPTKLSRYCDGLMEAGWIAALILAPAFFNVYSSRIFEPDKITLLRSLALVILAAWLIKLLDEGRARWTTLEQDKNIFATLAKVPLLLPVASLAVIYIIATLFSVTPRVSLWGSYQRLQGLYTTLAYLIVFATIAANLRRRVQVERLVTTAVLTSLPISLYGVLQRYQIDPVPWGGNVSTRIASNMGNSIFVAAYLIMIFPLTVGRILDSFRSILRENERLPLHVTRGTIYVFTAALQMIALYMSGSRGPALGWLAGLYMLALFLVFIWNRRSVAIGAVAVSVLMVAFLGVFNIKNGPLESLRNVPGVGRFGQLLDQESTTAKVRLYIWKGAADLVFPHDPLNYPDGSTDKLNFLRPLIGYGPESMYVAYNPFYPPELGLVEKRNASPDRSHNETWDSLVITGFLGLIVYLALFEAIFYYGLKWLNLVRSDQQRKVFLALVNGGALLGAAVLIAVAGVEYLGIGLPFGMLGGLWAYLAWQAFLPAPERAPLSSSEFARLVTIAVLLAAIVAHFVEINFGIAIVATRTYFWAYAGLLLVVGYILPKYGEYQDAQAVEVAQQARPSVKETRRASARKRRESHSIFTGRPWLRPALAASLPVTLLMMALGYDFISNSNQLETALEVIWTSLTTLPNRADAVSFGVLAMILTAWIAAVLLAVIEGIRHQQDLSFWKVLGGTLAISGAATFLFWLWHASSLATVSNFKVESLDALLRQVNMVGGLLTNYYWFAFLLVFLAGAFLPDEWPTYTVGGSVLGPLAALAAAPLIFVLIYTTNLLVIHADIAFKMAEPFNVDTQWPVATTLYQEANRRAPSEDHYYLFLGRSYLEQAKDLEPEAANQMVAEAEADLKKAQRINPLNTDHTANLARLYSWWATQSTDVTDRLDRAQIASRYYETAVVLSPQNSTLWGEWAVLYLEILNQPDEARARLEHALELDDRYNWTQGLMADYYARLARNSLDEQQRIDAFEQALVHYQRAVEVSSGREISAKISYLAAMASIHLELGQPNEAINAYLQALELNPGSSDLWRLEHAIATLYAQTGDKENALIHANGALSAAPEEQLATVQQLIAQITAMP